jgi:AcrR family transcriptional regulator
VFEEIVARTMNPVARAVRREAFIDAAQRLMEANGYEQTSIQDVLDELDASRGAFYHYFDSKATLLEAVVERMVQAAISAVAPIVTDSRLSAVEKLDGVFACIARWKSERTELVLAVLEVWQADDNAIVREKFRQGIVTRLAPLLATIIRQGQVEGAFAAGTPEHVARVVVSLLLSANEAAVDLWFARRAGAVSFDVVEHRLSAYNDAMERILGLSVGALRGVDDATLRQWYR